MQFIPIGTALDSRNGISRILTPSLLFVSNQDILVHLRPLLARTV